MNPKDYCILVAEDNDIVRHVTTRVLSQHGYCVIEACDGYEAIQLEAEYEGKIHLLVTAGRMPGMNGHELARQIKRKRADIKVLIVSFYGEVDFPPEARSHDFALLKPVDSESLIAMVALILRRRSRPLPHKRLLAIP